MEKLTSQKDRTSNSAKVIQVIETKNDRGSGTETDPNRIITQYWSLDGELLAEYDPHSNI
ncbi:carboxypeptidase [Paenibacillus polymyxa]|uniref:hypothetical protein n=1 Tax=Paenibacillus polymyxa TaxID=1406 RepID=UPI0008FB27E5|nr:hypothetical protein [Paenibacillus polymyxa]APB77432.1 carboxypeptidase [Paenibacillus polymyxa]